MELDLLVAAQRRRVDLVRRRHLRRTWVAVDRRQRQAVVLPGGVVGAVEPASRLPVRGDRAEGSRRYHRVIIDYTGERWRTREWALAEPRALGSLPAGWALWHPVESIGDVGAAFVPLAIGWATQAFARRYAGPGGILVSAMNDTGERAAVTLMPP